MTVSTLTNSVSYLGDGGTVTFPFTFACLDASHITVALDGVDQSTGFSVVVNADQSANPGGSVTFDTAPPGSVVIDIVRATDRTQQTDYRAFDPFPSDTHERALDKLTLIGQDDGARIEALDTAKLQWVPAPASSADTGEAGQIAYDADYIYLCVATDTWKRVALEAF